MMGVLEITLRAAFGLYSSVLVLEWAASPDPADRRGVGAAVVQLRQGEKEQGIITERQVIAPRGWLNHQNSGRAQGKTKGNASLSGDTQVLCPASHAEMTSTFIAPLFTRDLLLGISVGWSSV